MSDQIPMGALAGDYERCAHMLDDALQRIAGLEADNERLRAALRKILDSVAVTASGVEICQCSDFDCARRALEGKDG